MDSFFQALIHHGFLRYALLSGVLASVSCGIVGTYVVARRISYIAAGIAHACLAGMGAAGYLNKVHGIEWLTPLYGAALAALSAAVVIGIVSLRAREREDSAIGAIWAVGMAVGILFISQTPGYNENLMSYLFGNILMVSPSDLWMLLGLDILVIGVGLVFYHQLAAVCYDEEFARVRGISVEWFYLLLLCMTALTVVILVSVVGIVLIIALLTIPVVVAGHISRSLWKTMLLACLFSALFTTVGLALSYEPNLPAGATIILLAGTVYLLSSIIRYIARWRRG